MPTKLLRQIKNTLPELRKSEKLVADFVLKDPKSVVTMKTAEASSAMGISEPTLIRFCKAHRVSQATKSLKLIYLNN